MTENIITQELKNKTMGEIKITEFFKIHPLQDNLTAFNDKVQIRSIKIEIIATGENWPSNLKIHMKDIFNRLTQKCDETDLMSFKIVTDTLEFEPDDKTFKPMGKLNHELLENLIQNMARDKVFDVDDSFKICAKCVKISDERSECERCGCYSTCTDISNEIRCPDCLFDFYGHECFGNHSKISLSKRCEWKKKCPTCKKTYSNFETAHSCYCKACRTNYTGDHNCYMSDKLTGHDKSAFLFYRFETMQENDFGADEKLHKVNLCVALLVCYECFNSDLKKVCDSCESGGTRIFHVEPVVELMTWIKDVKLPTHIKRLVCIAHNFKDHEGQFILKYLVEHTDIKLNTIMNGTSIIFMNFKNDHALDIKFVDSVNYFDMKLTKLPETFGFENTYKKIYFPHSFNTKNQNYIGRLPDQKYYGIDKMDDKELSDFQEWYKKLQEEDDTFNFKEEIVEYCCTNVEILRKACYRFRDMFIKLASIDPFVDGAAMATICMKVFRSRFLRSDTLGLIPTGGYRKKARISVEWLLIVEKEIEKELVHIGRGSEYRVNDDIIVDGYVCKDDGSKHVYQFYECSWHGCPKCHHRDRDGKIEGFGDSYESRYKNTISTSNAIREMGYALTEKWECHFEKMRKTRKSFFLFNYPMLTKDFLNPRDTFYGGRIETYMAHREIVGDEKIHYIDVCSMYPWVNKYKKVPVGHPEVYLGDQCKSLTGLNNDLTRVEGLVKCRVLAPRNLYHPVLPVRINERTTFSLCRLCCENSEEGDCHHDNIADREFTGTWVSDELKKAVEMDYRITRIYEIWQYKVEQYDPVTKKGGIFTEYVNTFLKIKESASGWPANCTTSEAQERYVEEFKEREGIRLTPDKNPGLRFIAKGALNSLWGKFGERDYDTTKILRSLADLQSITSSSEKDLVDLQFINDASGYCKWKAKDGYQKVKEYTNVAIAAYTTAQARLKLYSYLEDLGDRVLHCNTDSCIYVSSRAKEWEVIPTGNFLGDMTDELVKDYGRGSYIKEFVSCGPKLYSMIVVKPDLTEEIIRKGVRREVRLNSSCNAAYSHENIKALALGEKDIIKCSYNDNRRTNDIGSHDIVTCEKKESSRRNFLKRRYPDKNRSYPFGYKETKG